MMKYIFLIISLFFTNFWAAQRNKIIDLSEFKYLELKNKFYGYYDQNKVPEAKQISKYYLKKAKKEKNILEIAEGYNLVHLNEDFLIALKYIDSLEVITKDVKGNLYPARTYLLRGNLYHKYDNLKVALDNYILGLKYAKEHKDEKQTAYANMNIAYIYSYIGKNAEAAKIFRYYLYNKNTITDDYQHNQIRIALISCYLEINKLDSANILIKEGQKLDMVDKNKNSLDPYSYLSGTYNLRTKKYNTAITKLSTAYTYFTEFHQTDNANYALYNLGQAYQELQNKEKALETYIKLDLSVQKSDLTFPELREAYTYLIDYYKYQNNKEKQLYYIERFLKVDKKLDEQFKYLSIELPKKYDTPNLLQEKEDIIKALKYRKIILYISIGILSLTLISLLYLYYRTKRKEGEYKKIAQNLIISIENKNTELSTIADGKKAAQMQIPKQFEIEKNSKTLHEDVAQHILKELTTFETKELFLKKGMTLASLAKNIKTNTTYLSDVINTYKRKNFSAYLNDLRIDFALNRLVVDKKFRSYKLSVIADELGYNNEQAFSLAFKKKTGTTLSMYIKEIDNLNVPKDSNK